MRSLEFMFEDRDEQVRYARKEGRYLNTRYLGFNIIHLYKVSTFYVELFFDVRESRFTDTKVTEDASIIKYFYPDEKKEIRLPFLNAAGRHQA